MTQGSLLPLILALLTFVQVTVAGLLTFAQVAGGTVGNVRVRFYVAVVGTLVGATIVFGLLSSFFPILSANAIAAFLISALVFTSLLVWVMRRFKVTAM